MGDVEGKPGAATPPAAQAAEVSAVSTASAGSAVSTSGTKEIESKKAADEDDSQSALKEWIELLVRAGLWALLIYVFLFQISIVDGESMMPTFRDGDRLVIDKLTYRFGSVHRYDVVVFEAVDVDRVPRRPKDYIKRVIGLPGQTVEIFDGSVWVDGERLDEKFGPTYPNRLNDPGQKVTFVVPPNQYFVMGDNRGSSKDSRVDDLHYGKQSLGFVARRQIRGVVRLRFLPWKEWTWFSRQ